MCPREAKNLHVKCQYEHFANVTSVGVRPSTDLISSSPRALLINGVQGVDVEIDVTV